MTDTKIKQLQKFLGKDEAALITTEENRFYFTGFPSSAGTLFVTADKAFFLIDFRYVEKARAVIPFCEVILAERGGVTVSDLAKKEGVTSILFETAGTSVSTYKSMKEKYGDMLSDSDRLDGFIRDCRMFKEQYELDLIKEAQRLTDDTFSYILGKIEPGKTEREIMLDMEFYSRNAGSEGASFEFIVVSGKNSSLPHGVPTDKKIEKGDFVTMDFGCIVGGYHSDMTRTVAVGCATDEMKKVYDTVKAAQDAAFAAIRPGVVCKDVDKASRDLIYAAGYEGCFGHGLGHSVGVEIHEYPNFNPVCEEILRPGHIMTVEPGIYLENKFGVRIEDMICCTENGFINITASPKDLIIL